EAIAINDFGQVVGYSDVAGGCDNPAPSGCAHAFYWAGGAMQDLGTLAPLFDLSEAYSINGYGRVVGSSFEDIRMPSMGHAFLWDPFLGMRDLNDLIPAGSGWIFKQARGINDNGEIVGVGMHNGEVRSFLLEPWFSPFANITQYVSYLPYVSDPG